MDIPIVMFVLIVRLVRPGNSLPAFNDVESATNYSNAPVDTKGFENNVIKAKEPLMHLIPMGNIEEVEKFGGEIEKSNKLPSLNRKARCKFSKISWRSRKAKTLGGVSTTPIKRISISRWNSASGEMGDSLRKPDIRAPPVARARDPTNIFNNEKTMKRENEHGVEQIVMLPPQTIDPVVVISEGAKTASNETPKSYVCGTIDTKDGQSPAAINQPMKIGIPLNSARATENPHYERNDKWSSQKIFHNFRLNNNQMTPGSRQPFGINRNVPLGNLPPKISQKHISHLPHAEKSMYQDTFVGNAMIQNNRNLGKPSVDDEDSFPEKHDVIKAPTNNLELDDCIKNYGLEHCIPVPGELRSYVPSHVGKSMHQDTLKNNAMIQNNRNLGKPFVDDEDSFPEKHDVIKAPTNNLELDDCIKNYGLEHCIPVPGELRSYVPSHVGKSMHQDTLKSNAMIQNNRNLGKPFVDDEDSVSNEHDVIKAPTNNLELDDCIKNYGLEHCIPVPGELRSYVPSHVGKSMHQDTLKSNAMIQNNRNLGKPFVDDEDSVSNEHDVIKAPTNNLELDDCIKNYGLEHCIPVPGELRSYVPSHVGKSMHQDTLKSNAMIQNNRNLGKPFVDDEDSVSNEHDVIKAPTNNLELDDCIKNYGLEHCIPVPGELRSYVPSHVGKSMHQDTLKSCAMIQNNRNLGKPFVDGEDSFSNEHDVIKAPTNNLELDDCIKNYGLEHCIPVPGELRSYVPSYVGKSIHQDTLKSNTMIENNRNLGKPFVDGEDSFSNEHDVIKAPTNNLELDDCIKNYGLEHCIPVPGELRNHVQNRQSKAHDQLPITSFHSIHGDPLTEQLSNDSNIPIPSPAKCAFVDSPRQETVAKSDGDGYIDTSTPENGHGQLRLPPKATNKEATEAPEIDVPAHPAMGLSSNEMAHEQKSSNSEESSTKLYNHAGKQNQVIGSGGSLELKRTSTTSIPDSLQDKSSSRKATAPEDRKLNDLPDSAADVLREKSDGIALARRLLLIPEVQHLALQDTKLFLSDMEDVNTFGVSRAQVADESPVTLLKNGAASLSTVTKADLQPVAQLAGQTEWTDQQTLPDENLKQYIKNVLHYSGLTAEGVQSEASMDILFRTIQHTLENAGFKVNNAHIWDTLRAVISQTQLPRMNPISVFPEEERTSIIRSTDMPKGGFKRLPFIPVKERVFKDGRWAERSTLLGSNRDRMEPKARKAQDKKFDSTLLADSGKASSDELKAVINNVAESAVGKSSPVRSESVTNEEEDEKTPIKYYSPAGRLLAYRKKIQVPKVIFRLDEKTKDSPRPPRLSPVSDSSFPVTSTAHSLPLATENGLKFTKDWSKSTSPVLPYTNSPSSEKFREKSNSSGNFDLRHDPEEFYVAARNESESRTVLKEDPAGQRLEESKVTESSLEAAKNSKRGTRYQRIPNNQMIVSQDPVSNHEQSSLIDRSPSATPEYDPTYFGKIFSTSVKSASDKMSDLIDTDLFYIGDGVKIPLKLTRMSDGSWGLSISEKICESSVKKKCPCNVPNEGDIVQEKRRQKKSPSFTKNTGPSPTPKNHFLLDGLQSSISDVDEPKERRTRSFLENDVHTTSSSPVTKFVEKYNLTLNPKNISKSSGPGKNSGTLNNNIGIIGSMNNEESLSTTPDSKCTENGKQTMNDISTEIEPQLHYDDDVTESPKNTNASGDENWTMDRGSNEIINSLSVPGNGNDNVSDSLQNEYNDNVLQAGNDEVMDRWSWVRDFVDSRRKHNMNPQDMDEAILSKIDDMFESEKSKVKENPIAHNVASTIKGSKNADPVKNLNTKLDHGKIAERKFRKLDDSNHTEFGVNSIDSSKESQPIRNNRPRPKNQDTDEANRETLIDRKKLKERDDYNFARMSNVKAKYDDRKDNPILKRIRNVNKKQRNARPYRYQQNIDNEAQERMDVMTGVLYWLKEVFFEPSAESDD